MCTSMSQAPVAGCHSVVKVSQWEGALCSQSSASSPAWSEEEMQSSAPTPLFSDLCKNTQNFKKFQRLKCVCSPGVRTPNAANPAQAASQDLMVQLAQFLAILPSDCQPWTPDCDDMGPKAVSLHATVNHE